MADIASWAAPAARPADTTAVRIAAGLRIVVAVSVAAAGSFTSHAGHRSTAFFLLAALVWVPWATTVLLASARPDNPLAVDGGPLCDLAVLFALEVLVQGAGDAVLLGYLAVVAFGVSTVPRRVAAILAATAIALAAVSQALVPQGDRLPSWGLVPFSAAVLALLFVLERTAARQAQTEARVERLQSRSDTILAHVADAVVVTSATGAVVQCNEAVEQLIGQPSARMVGQRCEDVLGLHHGERALDCSVRCALLGLVEEGVEDLGLEVWRARPDGRRQPILASASPLVGASGEEEVVHSLRDVTRLKQAEEAKNLFLATASHELKTPLTVIQGFSDTLARYPDLDAGTKLAALEAIHTRSMQLARIVDRLLMSSRIEAGRVSLVVADVDVAPLVAERVRSTAAGTGRAVTYLGPDVGLHAAANAEALVTVLDHLIDNALTYSPGGEEVAVSAEETPHGIAVAVADHGIGMDREQARHCFDKFWQAESTDVRRFGGTGIGLYIVQSLTEAMGASVTVDSTPGDGSTFTVALAPPPLVDVPQDVGEPTSIREFMRQLGVGARSRG